MQFLKAPTSRSRASRVTPQPSRDPATGEFHGARNIIGTELIWLVVTSVFYHGLFIHHPMKSMKFYALYILLYWLVVLTILKNMKVNGKDDIPYMKWKIKTCLKPPTSDLLVIEPPKKSS